MFQKGFSKIWILVIVAIVVAIGFLMYQELQISRIPEITEKAVEEKMAEPKNELKETPFSPKKELSQEEVPVKEKSEEKMPEKQVIQKCVDGTPYNQCSIKTQAKYCQNGILINKCSICGCPAGMICRNNDICIKTPQKSVLIFVDETTYQQLSGKINRLANDIENDLDVNVSVKHANYTSSVQIRNIIKSYYQTKRLFGSILIGSIPTFHQKNSLYYTDWFYKELSDRCPLETDGKFQYDAENCKPVDVISKADVFAGRITPPVSGSEGIALIKKYLDKNHNYRTEKLNFKQRMLIYPNISIYKDISYKKLNANLDIAISRMHTYSRKQIDLITTKNPESAKQEYLQKLLNNSYEIGLISIHGAPTSQQILGAISVSWEDIKNISPNAFFIDLVSCNNGAFQHQNYFAGWLLFSGNTLVVNAQTVSIGSGDLLPDLPIEPRKFIELSPLELGAPVGEMIRRENSDAVQSFGDLTLRMRRAPSKESKIIAPTKLDFGKVTGGKNKSLIWTIRNKGNSALNLRYMANASFTVDGEFSYSFDNPSKVAPGLNFQGFTIPGMIPFSSVITIAPGEKKDITFSFAPAVFRKTGLTQTGKYFDIVRFYTNDPTKPYLDIELIGEGVIFVQ